MRGMGLSPYKCEDRREERGECFDLLVRRDRYACARCRDDILRLAIDREQEVVLNSGLQFRSRFIWEFNPTYWAGETTDLDDPEIPGVAKLGC